MPRTTVELGGPEWDWIREQVEPGETTGACAARLLRDLRLERLARKDRIPPMKEIVQAVVEKVPDAQPPVDVDSFFDEEAD